MAEHNQAVTGLWLYSNDEEQWQDGPFFDTREEVVAYGKAECGAATSFWVGKVGIVVTPTLAAEALLRDSSDADQWMSETHDLTAEEALLHIDDRKRAMLVQVVAEWIRGNSVLEGWFQVEDSERVCVETDE